MGFPFLPLSFASLWNRRASVLLTILSIAASVMLLSGVEKIRQGARAGFEQTVSGTDLIVGARTGQINLLLYTVFRIGEGTGAMSMDSYDWVAGQDGVAWTVPLSLGDSHKGFRVLGTDNGYFEHFRYGRDRALTFDQGGPFDSEHDVVIGAGVARALGYRLGDEIHISHGLVSTSFADHDEAFTVTGILAATGTPVDRTVHVTLEGLDHAHDGMPGTDTEDDERITAMLVGLTSRPLALRLQFAINNYDGEPLLAIMPGLTLGQLWSLLGAAEAALLAISGFVILIGLLGLLTRVLSSLNERRREMAILRAVGARPGHIFALLVFESALTAFLGAVLGLGVLYAGMAIAEVTLAQSAAIPMLGAVTAQGPSLFDLGILAAVTGLAALLGMMPAWQAYRHSLQDGLSIRI